ncbi:MAG: T9SS type A sorting domain-containing protein [Bacteroidota bacterium]
MKKSLILVVKSIIFLFICQNYAYSYGLTSDSNYVISYPDKYHKTLTCTYLVDSTWINRSFESITFDDKSRVTEDVLQYWQNNAFINDSKNLYQYDSVSNINSHQRYKWENGNWVLNYIDSTCYFDNGKVQWDFYFDFENNSTRRYEYEYKQISANIEEIYKTNPLNGYYHYKTKIIYNDSGLVLFENFYLMDSSKIWFFVDSTVYIYNKTKNTKEVTYWAVILDSISHPTKEWFNFKRLMYYYDFKGNLIKFESGWFWNDINYETYERDSLNRIIHEKHGGTYGFEENLYYIYDDSSRVVNIKINVKETPILTVNENSNNNFNTFCFPNPFSESTNIKYSLNRADNTELIIYNYSGMEIERINLGYKDAGEHLFTFDAHKMPSGFYYYVLQAGTQKFVNKMQLLR